MALPGPALAQSTRDWQVHSLAAFSADRFLGAGLGLGMRPPGRLRIALNTTAGALEGRFAARAEGLLSFHLNAGRESGASPYAGAGVAARATRVSTRGYVLVLIGLEQRPGRRAGWFLEAGVGGGLRVSAGYRFRWGSGIRR